MSITENRLHQIESKYICRKKQIRKLLHFLQLESNIENIILNGPKSTAKTSITHSLLNEFNYTYLWFDMINYDHLNRFFFEKILQQFQLKLNNIEQNVFNDIEHKTCFNSIQFIDYMKYYLKIYKDHHSKNENLSEKIVIVIDNGDYLVDEYSENVDNLIYLLNNLNQLTDNILPITVIWIFKHQLDRLYRLINIKMNNMIEIEFEPYSQNELFQLLTNDRSICKNDKDNINYKNFVNLILKTLILFENNYENLRFICVKYFKKYLLPLEDDNLSVHNKQGQLYMKFQPYLQEIIDQLSGICICKNGKNLNRNIQKLIDQMSISLCYTYVSIYLATYNSIKTDVKFFVRNQKRNNNSSKRTKKSNDNEIKCPKWFELERSYHIYRSIIDLNEKDEEIRKNLLTKDDKEFLKHIATLYDSKILLGKTQQQQQRTICSGDTKFQLSQVISDDIIIDISNKINLDLNAFLVHPIERSNDKQIQ